MSRSSTYRRRSARVLVVDRTGRVLLLQIRSVDSTCWLTPGGGVHQGETLVAAARRELAEEIGLRVTPSELTGPVAWTAGYARFTWGDGWFRDDFFHLRVDGHEVDTSQMEDLERGLVSDHRWWSLDELAATDEAVYPLGLGALLADLATGSRPDPPVELLWHHDETPPASGDEAPLRGE